jgi:hypothetical protein
MEVEKKYTIKPLVWVEVVNGLVADSICAWCFWIGQVKEGCWLSYYFDELDEDHVVCGSVEEAKAKAEELRLARLLPALEEVA